MQNPEELIVAVEQAGEEYARLIEGLSEAAFHRRPEPEWSVAELTGHVAESTVLWAEQALLLAGQPGLLVGRFPDDPVRLAAVENFVGKGPVEAAAAVRKAVRRAASVLREIPPDGWRSRGQHRRLGELDVAGFVEQTLVDHLHSHIDQARAAAAP